MYPVLVSSRKGRSPPISASFCCCFIFGWDLTVVIRRGGGPQKLFLHYCKTLISDRLGFLSLFFLGGGYIYVLSFEFVTLGVFHICKSLCLIQIGYCASISFCFIFGRKFLSAVVLLFLCSFYILALFGCYLQFPIHLEMSCFFLN